MAVKGELRVRCGVDRVGDYFASVEVYCGFWTGWKSIKKFWAISGRTPETALASAQQWKSNKTIPMGVIN